MRGKNLTLVNSVKSDTNGTIIMLGPGLVLEWKTTHWRLMNFDVVKRMTK